MTSSIIVFPPTNKHHEKHDIIVNLAKTPRNTGMERTRFSRLVDVDDGDDSDYIYVGSIL